MVGENTNHGQNNIRYIKGITEGESWYEIEQLTFENRVNEWIMIRLRTAEGMDWKETEMRWGYDIVIHIQKQLQSMPKSWFLIDDVSLKLTNSGKLMADNIIMHCMIS